jgi:hypothetical protein
VPLIGLLTALACVATDDGSDPIASTDTVPEDQGETGDSDTGDSGAIDSTDTADTADTAVSLPGTFVVNGVVDAQSVALACDADTSVEQFPRSWASSLGNISGTASCADAEGNRATLTFISPHEGEWTDTSEGLSWIFQSTSGDVLAYGVPDTSAWHLTVTEFGYADATTITLTGTLAGTWLKDGAGWADLTGSFDLQIPCSGC